MESGKNLTEILDGILERDSRYEVEAYNFMLLSFNYTATKLGINGHITASELMDGAKEYAVDKYGPMSLAVLQHWGIKDCGDFGEIVKILVDTGLLGKSESDDYKDFVSKGFDFKEAFGNFFKI